MHARCACNVPEGQCLRATSLDILLGGGEGAGGADGRQEGRTLRRALGLAGQHGLAVQVALRKDLVRLLQHVAQLRQLEEILVEGFLVLVHLLKLRAPHRTTHRSPPLPDASASRLAAMPTRHAACGPPPRTR